MSNELSHFFSQAMSLDPMNPRGIPNSSTGRNSSVNTSPSASTPGNLTKLHLFFKPLFFTIFNYVIHFGGTGKSISEALIFASTNPQYDNRFFIELPLQYMKIPSSEHGENTGRT